MQLKIEGKTYDVRKEVGELIHMISKERDVLKGFVDDWNGIFPDKGPREIRAELDKATESPAPSGQAELTCYVLSCTTGRKLRATITTKSRLRKFFLLPWLMVEYEGTNLSGPCTYANWMRPGNVVGYTDNT